MGSVTDAKFEPLAGGNAQGIAKAKSKSVRFAAKPKLSSNQIGEMKEKRKDGVLIKDLMGEFGLSKASVYRMLSC